MAILWVLLIIALVILILYYVVLGIIYGVAYLGMSIIIGIDYVASSFTWLGVKSPIVGWLLLGCLTGATVGLIIGLRKAGRRSDLWKVYGGATLLVVLLLISAHLGYPPGSTTLGATDSDSSVTSPSLPTTNSTNTRNLNTNPTVKGRRLKSSSRVTVGRGAKFEVRITGGAIYSDYIVLNVRETSVDYTGQWLPWQSVIAASYLRDSSNNTYYPDISQSTGWTDGNIRPGSYRDGRIVFAGIVPPNVHSLTLFFAYYPGNTGDEFAMVDLTFN